MPTIKPPEIPQEHVDFAKAVAELADNFGMDQFEMTYRPVFENRMQYPDLLGANLKITYKSVDGRGRPSRNLNIHLEARMVLNSVRTPSSSS